MKFASNALIKLALIRSISRTLQSNEPKRLSRAASFRKKKVFLQLQIINTQPHHSPTTARNGLTYALIPYIYRIVPSCCHSSRDRSHSSAQPASQPEILLKESKEVPVASVQRIFKVVSQHPKKERKQDREMGYRYKNRQKQRR